MIIKTLVAFILSVVLVSPVAARVQSEDFRAGSQPAPTSNRLKEVPPQKDLSVVKAARDEARRKLEEQKEAFKASLEQKREEFKNSLEAKRTEVKDKIEAKKVELKENLLKIKNERKKEIVERISNQLNELNKRRLDHFSGFLEKLDAILLRIAGRADKAEARGLDVTAVRAAITEAKNAIAVGRAAITTQAEKVYSVVVTTEDTLKINVGAARKMLHDDLTRVQEAVRLARETVRKAAEVLAKIPKVDDEELKPVSTE